MNKKAFLEKSLGKKAFLGKSLGKKGIAGDALIIAISFIIVATIGAVSFSMFTLNIFGPNVKQIITEFEYNEGLNEIFLDFLKEDSGYKGLNNLGLILLNTNNKLDHNVASNKIIENMDLDKCWFILIAEEEKAVKYYEKPGCNIDVTDPKYKKTFLKFIAFDRNLDISLGVKE